MGCSSSVLSRFCLCRGNPPWLPGLLIQCCFLENIFRGCPPCLSGVFFKQGFAFEHAFVVVGFAFVLNTVGVAVPGFSEDFESGRTVDLRGFSIWTKAEEFSVDGPGVRGYLFEVCQFVVFWGPVEKVCQGTAVVAIDGVHDGNNVVRGAGDAAVVFHEEAQAGFLAGCGKFAKTFDALLDVCVRDGFATGRATAVGPEGVASEFAASVNPFEVVLDCLFAFGFIQGAHVSVAVHRDVEELHTQVVCTFAEFGQVPGFDGAGCLVFRIFVLEEGAVEFEDVNVEFFYGEFGEVQQVQGIVLVSEPAVDAPSCERDFHTILQFQSDPACIWVTLQIYYRLCFDAIVSRGGREFFY